MSRISIEIEHRLVVIWVSGPGGRNEGKLIVVSGVLGRLIKNMLKLIYDDVLVFHQCDKISEKDRLKEGIFTLA